MTISSADSYREPLEELRRLAREPYLRNQELLALRARLNERRSVVEREALEIVMKANPDLGRVLTHEHSADLETRSEAREVYARLEEQAVQGARDSRQRFHTVRRSFLDTFGAQLAAAEGKTQLKFRDAIFWSNDTQLARCTETTHYLTEPVIGPDVTSEAEIIRSPDGLWLHPFVSCDNNNCVLTEPGSTSQHITYRMPAPAQSFAVDRVRVDSIANGLASSHLGGSWGWFPRHTPDPLFEHTSISLDVYIAQQIDGGWHYWPLVSDTVFRMAGDYAGQVRIALSGNAYTAAFTVRNAASGGGPVLCLVQVTCSITSTGKHGHARLDFRAASGLGIFVGGVALLGGSLI